MSLIGDWAEKTKNAFGSTLKGYVENVAKPVGRGISTAVLLTDKDNPVYKDGFQLTDIKQTFDDYAGEISPGQALLGGSEILQPFRGVAQLVDNKLPTFAKENFDLYDESQRKQAFQTEMTGRILSGSVDAAVTWYTDPLSKVGKGLSIARKGLLDTSLSAEAAKGAQAFKTSGWNQFIDEAVASDATTLLRNRVVAKSSNPELLASVLGDITTARFGDNAAEVARTVLKAATGGLEDSKTLWNDINTVTLAAKVERAGKKSKIEPLNMVVNSTKKHNGDINAMLLEDVETANKLTSELNGIFNVDKFVRNAVELAEQNILGTGASKFAAVEKLRAARARQRTNVRIRDFNTGPYGQALRVVSWLQGQTPSGWVATKGIQSSGSADEIIAFVNQVKPWNNAQGALIKRDLINKYVGAATDIERGRIVTKIEKDALAAIATEFKFNKPLSQSDILYEANRLGINTSEIKTTADVIYHETSKRRGILLDKVRRDGHYTDDDLATTIVPFVSSQLADSVPMINLRVFQKLAKAHSNSRAAFGANAGIELGKAYEAFNAVWRPSVLLRLGYTIRNVTEGSLRVMGYLGSIEQYLSGAGRSLKESIRNSYLATVKQKALLREGAQVVGASPRAIAKWADLEEIQLRTLNAARQDLFNAKKTLDELKKSSRGAKGSNKEVIRTSINKTQRNIKSLETTVNKLTTEAQEFEAKFNLTNRIRKFDKSYTHQGMTLQGVFEGDIGLYAKSASSAVRRSAIELRDPLAISQINLQGKLASKGYGTVYPPVFDEAGKLIGGNAEYWNALNDLSRVYRNDEITRRLLMSDNIDETITGILRAAKKDKKIQTDLINSNVALNSDDIAAHAYQLADDMQRIFPDRALRKAIASGEVTGEKIRTTLAGRTDLSEVSGEILTKEGWQGPVKAYQEFTSKWFRRLGAIPEDTMVRHPLYRSVYEKSLNELVDRAVKSGRGKQFVGKEIKSGINNGQFNKMIETAHRAALKETTATAYTIARYSSPAQFLSYISPFVQAYANTLRVWGKLTYDNPAIIGRANLIWSAPEKAGVITKDERTGDSYISLQLVGEALPEWLQKRIGDNVNIQFPKNSLNLIFQGEPWFSPGFGPIAQVPVSEFLKRNPDINETLTKQFGFYVPARGVLDAMLGPAGPSGSPASLDLILPASAKRLKSLMRGTADVEYAKTVQGIYAVETQRYKEGLRPDAPTYDEVSSKANWMMALRFVGALTLPFQPKFASEYEPWIQLWKKYQKEGEIDGLSPSERYYRDYPDYFTFAYSSGTSKTGMDFTTNAVDIAKDNKNLLGALAKENPYLIQLITNDGRVEQEFDQAVYVWQLKNSPIPGGTENFRGNLDPLSEVDRQDIKAGWIKFNQLNDALDVEMKKYGINSFTGYDGEQFKAYRDAEIEKIAAEYPTWDAERKVFEIGKWRETLRGFEAIVQDTKFMSTVGANQPAWVFVQDYLESRDQIVQELAIREYNGNSKSITSQDNSDLNEAWQMYVNGLKSQNTDFAAWYNRFLENDPLEKI
jgi:hypothetical protein